MAVYKIIAESPAGEKAVVTLNSKLDDDLVRLAMLALLGAFSYLGNASESDKREFTLKLVANIITTSESMIRSMELNQLLSLQDSDPASIVESFLKSLSSDEHT